MHDFWQPPFEYEITAPHPARMRDYYLGGRIHYQVDRDAADAAVAAGDPEPLIAWERREFLRRTVPTLIDQGVTQFVAVGTGIPRQDAVHEIAQRRDPECRVVYVDDDPFVLDCSRFLLADTPRTAVVEGTAADPAAFLADPVLRDLLDIARPVAVALLAAPPVADPAVVAAALAAGSHLLVTEPGGDGWRCVPVARVPHES
ncbi:SAM-dependent methyltransferase [Longispora sp. K20-0274]|uniref:SAM-dependent methyltransferase n=1 Tax=Longispora sp. K20-0274 TaxID=3088255 RepID=UPI00399B3B27